MALTLAHLAPGAVVWAHVRGYWRRVEILEPVRGGKVRVWFRVGQGGHRTREQDVALEWLRIERPKTRCRVVETPAPVGSGR